MDGGIEGQLVLIIDTAVSLEDLPVWLRRSKAIIQTKAAQASREIQQSLVSMLPLTDRKPLVGREKELSDFSARFVPGNRLAPHFIVGRGLSGVGRRSVLERAFMDTLDLRLGPYFQVDNATTTEDLYLFLLDEMAETGRQEDLNRQLHAFRQLEDGEKTTELSGLLAALCDSPAAPCLIDEGGLLDHRGAYAKEWRDLFSSFLEMRSDRYLAVLHTRRPTSWTPHEEEFFELRVDPLDDGFTRLLLTQLMRRAGVVHDAHKLEELAEYVDGYPPAAIYATQHAKQYGLDVLLADKQDLSAFKAKQFRRFFSELDLTSVQWNILTYLGNERGLPFGPLSVALDIEDETLAVAIKGLIDFSLIQVRADIYSISAPARQSLYQVRDFPKQNFYQKVAERLDKAFWRDEENAPSLAVIDATLHASTLSGRRDIASPAQAFLRSSTIHRTANESYHRAEYEQALEYSLRGQEWKGSGQDSRDRELREIAYKSLVRLKRWPEAEEMLKKIEDAGDRHFYFLDGFGSRIRGNLTDALASFKAARDTGDTRIAVYREIAFCSFGLGDLAAALTACEAALARENQSQNLFLLDLLVKINFALGDTAAAEAALSRLEAADAAERFIHHRRATYYLHIDDFDRALDAANDAVNVGHAKFEAYAQRAGILIEAGRFIEAAQAIDETSTRFPRDRNDVLIGLRCKNLTRQGQWREAMQVWRQLESKNKPVHQGLKRAILVLKAKDYSVALFERQSAIREAESILEELEALSGGSFVEAAMQDDNDSPSD